MPATDREIATDPTTPRVLLFGHPGSGKSSLLGALVRAGEVQPDVLGGEVVDPSGRLDRIRDHVYAGAHFENTRTELVTYVVRLRRHHFPDPLYALLDCDGDAANALLKHPDPLTDRRVRGTLAAAVVRSDLIALVVNAGATDRQLQEAFDEFLMFLERVHGRKAFEREVGGFPILVVLSQCDRLARPGDTARQWEARVAARRRYVLARFAEFLEDESHAPGIQSPYLPFGSVRLTGYAVGVRRPPLADAPDPPDEPYGVAELFRDAFDAAAAHRRRVLSSDRRLKWTVWAVAFAVWALLAGMIAVAVFQPPPADPGLAGRVEAFARREGSAAERLAEKNIARNRRALQAFQSDPGFFALPEDLRAFVAGRLQEIEDYQAYRAKLLKAPVPADARTREELARTEGVLRALAWPPQYTWAETEAGRLREKWLADVPLIAAAEERWDEWYWGLIRRAQAVGGTGEFGGDWRPQVAALLADADRPPFDPDAPIPGSAAVPQPRGDPVTYRVPFEFDRVYQTRRDWDTARANLVHLRDLAEALGLTLQGDPGRPALELPEPGPGVDSASLPGSRLNALRVHFPRPSPDYPRLEGDDRAAYPEWLLSNFRGPARAALAGRVRVSFGHGVRHVHRLVRDRLGSPPDDTPEGWQRVADALDGPAFRDWGRLLHLLARLETPSAPDPVAELAAFLGPKVRDREFALGLTGFELTIPVALRLPPVVPTGPLTVTVTPRGGGSPVVKTFRPTGEPETRGVARVYRFVPDGDGKLTYRPGDELKVEVPVRSGDQKLTLRWEEGGTRTFQFDRLGREPRLVREGAPPEPATGVTLTPTPGSAVPQLPVLLPEVRR